MKVSSWNSAASSTHITTILRNNQVPLSGIKHEQTEGVYCTANIANYILIDLGVWLPRKSRQQCIKLTLPIIRSNYLRYRIYSLLTVFTGSLTWCGESVVSCQYLFLRQLYTTVSCSPDRFNKLRSGGILTGKTLSNQTLFKEHYFSRDSL